MEPISKIVIVGGGTAGWLAAAMLRHHLKPDVCSITLVESEELGTIGIGESTVPPFVGLLQRLGIDERDFVRKTDATYKLGIQFVGWHQQSDSYFHPFGAIGREVDSYDFYQCWLKARALGERAPLQDFSPCNVMAQHGRFFPPGKARNTPIGGASYALHVDATLAARYLREFSEARGLERIEGRVVEVQRREDGFIHGLLLASGERLDGDFFIDATGFRALLIEQALGVGFNDWSNYLACDRAITVRTAHDGPLAPYTRATAQGAGWTWRIPLQHRLGHGYVYASRFCSDAAAKATLMRSLKSPLISEPKLIKFMTGHRRQFWAYNCLSLGLAAGFIEPLESTAIHLIARGMDFFLRYFPDRTCDPALVREYNRRMLADFEEVRDFIVLHYCATRRDDTPFWQWCQQIDLPNSLKERIELFKRHGATREGVDELFRSSSWQSVFEGMGIRPSGYCPRVDNLDPARLRTILQRARHAIHGMVAHLPTHEEFLKSQQEA
jgi:tryptophan halogenase